MRVGELEAEPEAAVGERQTVDVEAQESLARAVGPAERSRVLWRRRENEARLVVELEGQPRRQAPPAPRRRAGAHCDRLAGQELRALVALRPEEARLGDPRLAAAPLLQAGRRARPGRVRRRGAGGSG